MTRSPAPLANAIHFVILSCLAWLCAYLLFALALDNPAVDPFATAPSLWQAVQYALTVILFAFVQRWLMRRYLRAELPRWMQYSIVGALAGAACYLVFRQVVPNPTEYWQLARISPPPERAFVFVKQVYYGISDFFKFGLVAFVQFFALPRHLRGRRMWLLAALLAAPLWSFSQSMVAVMILSLALACILARDSRKVLATGQTKRQPPAGASAIASL